MLRIFFCICNNKGSIICCNVLFSVEDLMTRRNVVKTWLCVVSRLTRNNSISSKKNKMKKFFLIT